MEYIRQKARVSIWTLLAIFVFAPSVSRVAFQTTARAGHSPTPDERRQILHDVFRDLRPKQGSSALLLGFDTDVSADSESYRQFYDENPKAIEKKPTNQTLLFVRKGETVSLAAKLDYIASPQKNGWLYLGQARYFEPKPRDKNDEMDGREKDGSFKNFGFDYTRVWKTDSRDTIPLAERSVVRRTKAEIDAEYRRLRPGEREYQRNITDYEKIGYISDGYYIVDGFWSHVRGGASWFDATERSNLVNLSGSRFSSRLERWYPKSVILKRFASDFDENYRHGPDAKYNDMDYFWQTWKDSLKGKNADRIPTFTLERHLGKTHFVGRVLADGNSYRSFFADADLGAAPKKLVKYDNPDLQFEKLELVYPELIDIFISPNQNTAYLLTKTEIIAIDVASLNEIYRNIHDVQFNKVIMVEWAVGEHVQSWSSTLAK